jgi:preprotein translocase subunit SecY
LTVIGGFILVFLAIYNPLLNKILGTVALSVNEWLIVGSVSLLVTIIIEVYKVFPGIMKKSSRYGKGFKTI